LPDQAPTLPADSPPAPAQLDYKPSPEPEQAITAPSLAAQHSAHAHASETAVQGQDADSNHHSGSPGCHLEEEHADQTDGSNGPDLDSAHFIITTVAADQADREEEVSDVEEEEYEEQDSAHLTIMDAPADQAEEDGAAEEEEYEQQSEPAQDPASGHADEDDSSHSSSGDEEDYQEGKAVMTSSSAGSSGTAPVPSNSSTTSSDGPAVPTPAVDAAGDCCVTDGLSAAIPLSPEDAGSTNISTGGPSVVPSFEAERVGDALVSLVAAAQHQVPSITADSGDAHIPSSSAQTEEISTPPAGAAEMSTPPAGAAEISTPPAGIAEIPDPPAGTANVVITAAAETPQDAATLLALPHAAQPGSEDIAHVTGAESRSPWQPGSADVQPAADKAEEEQRIFNETGEEDEEHPVYDSLEEEEEGEGEEVSSSQEEDAAEEEEAATSEYEEDETKGLFESEDEEDVPSDQDGETALHRRIKELDSQE